MPSCDLVQELTPKTKKILELEQKLSNLTIEKNDYQEQLQNQNLKFASLITELGKEKRNNLQKTNEIENLKAELISACETKNALEQNVEELRVELFEKESESQSFIESSVEAKEAQLLEITKNVSGDGTVIEARYSGTTSQSKTYVHAPYPRKFASSEATDSAISARLSALKLYLSAISSKSRKFDVKNVASTISKFLDKNPEVKKLFENEYHSKIFKLSPEESLDLKTALGISWDKYNKMKTYLMERNMDIFASFDAAWKQSISRKIKTKIDFEYINFTNEKGEITKSPSCFVSNLEEFIRECWARHIENKELSEDKVEFKKKIWIAFGGDKGGKTTKITFSFTNCQKPNSVHNTHVIGYYEGNDDHQSLQVFLKKYQSQFLSISNMTLPYPLPDGSTEERPIIRFLVGDIMFLSAMMGHKGPTSLHPCFKCKIPLNQIRPDLKKLKKIYFKKHSKREYGQIIKNVSQIAFPIFPFDAELIVPPALHIPLGVFMSVFRDIVELCKKIDLDHHATKKSDKKLETDLKNKCKTAEKLRNVIKNMESDMSLISKISNWIQNQINKGVTMDDTDSGCSAPICLLKMPHFKNLKSQSGWLMCDNCSTNEEEVWYHNECSLLFFQKEQEAANTSKSFSCLRCTQSANSAEEILKLVNEKQNLLQSELDKIKIEYNQAKQTADNYLEKVKFNRGPAMQALEKSLDEIGVNLMAYHSNTFVGNHMFKMLRQDNKVDAPKILTSILKDCPIEQKQFYDFLTFLSKIFNLTSAARFLNDSEINDLENYCDQLKEFLIETFPYRNITPKLHILLEHVPEFVKEFKTLGLLSEQGIESLHAQFNRIDRLFKMRGDKRRMPLIYNFNIQIASIKSKKDFIPSKRRKLE